MRSPHCTGCLFVWLDSGSCTILAVWSLCGAGTILAVWSLCGAGTILAVWSRHYTGCPSCPGTLELVDGSWGPRSWGCPGNTSRRTWQDTHLQVIFFQDGFLYQASTGREEPVLPTYLEGSEGGGGSVG